MKVLVVGSGGREHAICWKLDQSPQVEKLYCAPGNAGTAEIAENVDITVGELERLADFANEKGIDLAVIGPEAPLCEGLADMISGRGIPVFGPAKAAATLEGSKVFSKEFMRRYGIPTARAQVFKEPEAAREAVVGEFKKDVDGIVVKADGLAAGKGVFVAQTEKEALQAIDTCFAGAFGDAGRVVLVEELLKGEEASILALCDGKTVIPLASSQDHKRVGENDTGPNTGGMGAYSPAPIVGGGLMKKVEEEVLQRFLKGVKTEKMEYRGIIYAGIMVCESGPKVLEFNVRFGDPETQAVLPRLRGDLAEIMLLTATGELEGAELDWTAEPAVCVVMASGGYPGSYEKGFEIKGIESAEATGALVFHAGTQKRGGALVNSGGRVLGVTALGEDIKKAVHNTYAGVEEICWKDCFYRRDIAHKALSLQAPE